MLRKAHIVNEVNEARRRVRAGDDHGTARRQWITRPLGGQPVVVHGHVESAKTSASTSLNTSVPAVFISLSTPGPSSFRLQATPCRSRP